MALSDRLRAFAGAMGNRLQRFSVQPHRVPNIGSPTPTLYAPQPKALEIVNNKEAMFGSIATGAGPTVTRVSSYPATALDPTKIVSVFSDADKGIVYRYAELAHQVW